MDILEHSYIWIATHFWALEILLLLCLLFILDSFLKKVFTSAKTQAKEKSSKWLAHLDLTLLTPIRLLLWIVILALAIDLLVTHFALTGVCTYTVQIRNIAIVTCFTWFLFRWKTGIYKAMKEKTLKGKGSLELPSLEIFDKAFTAIVIFIASLVLLSLFHIDVVPLITFGGIGAAAVGFASKDVIANFFGGLMLYASRPFMINDLIELPQKKLTGYIEKIGWYFTSLRDLEKNLIYIPNSFFPTEVVINLSRITHRRFNELITVHHADIDKIPSLIASIRRLLQNNPLVAQDLRADVYLSKAALHGFDIEVKVYLSVTSYEEFMAVRQEILLAIYQVMEKEGLQKVTLLSALETLKRSL